jgi:hypothetical protein
MFHDKCIVRNICYKLYYRKTKQRAKTHRTRLREDLTTRAPVPSSYYSEFPVWPFSSESNISKFVARKGRFRSALSKCKHSLSRIVNILLLDPLKLRIPLMFKALTGKSGFMQNLLGMTRNVSIQFRVC